MRVSDVLKQDGERIKLNATEIAVGNKDNPELLPSLLNNMLNHLGNIEVVASSSQTAGTAIDMEIPINHIYLLVVGRDNAMYIVSRYNDEVNDEVNLTPINDFHTIDIEIVGNRLVVGFRMRNRSYVLLRLR